MAAYGKTTAALALIAAALCASNLALQAAEAPSDPPAQAQESPAPRSCASGVQACPAGGPQLLAYKDCSEAPNCSDGCYCNYENCANSCRDGDADCVNRCLKSLYACLDCCNGKC